MKRCASMVVAICGLMGGALWGQLPTAAHAPCQIRSATFEGWKAQEISNDWVRLTIVPQLGGRLMQVTFGSHPYLFVNARYKGQYISPADAKGRWINYGGDKIWPMPEGTQDEQHWPGPYADPLDDGVYEFKVLFRGPVCTARLDGPADPRTGLQYSRDISLRSDSPEVSFHAVMKNASGHPITWSMQSVSQYDLADAKSPGSYNHDFWAFTPVNTNSAYPNRYHVRSGVADAPVFGIHDSLFTLHYSYLENEIWIDSTGGWLAVADGESGYGMVERFRYQPGADYPGKATVIFYTNGPSVEVHGNDAAKLSASNPDDALYYMEAELNSPMARLEPGEVYAMDTHWFPVRMGRELSAVTDAGVVGRPLKCSNVAGGLELSGTIGVFFSGKLIARAYDARGAHMSDVSLLRVDPTSAVELNQKIEVPQTTGRVSVHLIDDQGNDRGSLGEVAVSRTEKGH